ncbi:MAG: hypothetical protein GY916_01090, partial [Gammaproteobacteria bacterium]|nr:hypothetical protein [Gammaproteobacteria bacterium]
MSISRRHFILGSAGAAAGLILPSYYQQALEFIDRTGKPLLKTVERPSTILTASIVDWGDLQYNLAVGADPYAGPPLMTLAEFVNRYEVDPYERLYEDLQEGEEPDWEAEVDWG